MAIEETSRRAFLMRAGGTVLGGTVLAGTALSACGSSAAPPESSEDGDTVADRRPKAVAATGAHQAGVSTPVPPQPNLLMVIFDLDAAPGPLLARLGETIIELVAGKDARLAGVDPGDLTVTIGVGPRLVAMVDATLPGGTPLPRFGHEDVPEDRRGGDLMVQVCATDPLLLPLAVAALADAGGDGMRERWRQQAFRGSYVAVGDEGYAPRNVVGFVDGIVVPRSPAALDDSVWIQGTPVVTGGTVAVVRRMEIDLDRFLALPVTAQEDVIGRRRASSAPLSGGTIATVPDIDATAADGSYLIPRHAHIRWANPTMSDVTTMLRRSYSIVDSAAGLLFISFQNDPVVFATTLQRMDPNDALLDYTTTTATASFLVLPGFDRRRPLGATLFTVT